MLEVTVDKFTFRVPENLLFSDAGVWVEPHGERARLGISDFAQQVSGDIAFATVREAGTDLAIGEEFASIETVKVNLELPSPVDARIVEINPQLQDRPELINQDPYENGWMAVVELRNSSSALAGLLDARRYLQVVRTQAETELKK